MKLETLLTAILLTLTLGMAVASQPSSNSFVGEKLTQA